MPPVSLGHAAGGGGEGGGEGGGSGVGEGGGSGGLGGGGGGGGEGGGLSQCARPEHMSRKERLRARLLRLEWFGSQTGVRALHRV